MAEVNANSVERPQRGRRWFRFSLKLVFVVMTISAMWLGFAMKRIRERHEAIEAIRRLEGRVILEGTSSPNKPLGVDAEIGPGAPAWLRNLLGQYGKHLGSGVETIVLVWPDNPSDRDQLLHSVAMLSEARLLVLELHRTDDRELLALPKLPNFHELFVRPRQIESVSDKGLRCLERMPKLHQLRMESVTIGAEGYGHLADSRNLQLIRFSRCNLSVDGLDQLAQLTELSHLYFVGSTIGDESVEILSRLQGLKELNVSLTNFTRNGVDTLRAALPNCQIESGL
jgi:hypothetical protein